MIDLNPTILLSLVWYHVNIILDWLWYHNVIGIAAAIISTIGYIPQVIKMYRSKSVKDISGKTLLLLFVAQFLWGIHGHQIGDMIIIANTVIPGAVILSCVVAGIVEGIGLILYYKYR